MGKTYNLVLWQTQTLSAETTNPCDKRKLNYRVLAQKIQFQIRPRPECLSHRFLCLVMLREIFFWEMLLKSRAKECTVPSPVNDTGRSAILCQFLNECSFCIFKIPRWKPRPTKYGRTLGPFAITRNFVLKKEDLWITSRDVCLGKRYCNYCWIMNIYHPQRSWDKVIFSEACVKNSARGGVCPIACWDTPPPGSRRLPQGADTPPPQSRGPPPPGIVHAERYGQQAGGTILVECILVMSWVG